VESIRLDLAWFESDFTGEPDVDVTVRRGAPDFDAHGDAVASFITPRNVVYQQTGRTLVDYFGRALSVVENDGRRLVIEG